MVSAIDVTKPAGPIAYTSDVRNNFTIAKSEIELLQDSGKNYLSTKGGTLTGPLTLHDNATLPMHAVPMQQVNSPLVGGPFLPLNGSRPMSAPLTLAGNATLDLQAVPLQQLNAAPYLPIAGGSLLGNLLIHPGDFHPILTIGGAGSSYSFLEVAGSAGSTRSMRILTDGYPRWSLETTNNNEPGDGSGCDLGIMYSDDAGNFANIALVFSRKTGLGQVVGDPVSAAGIATKRYVDNAPPAGGPYLPLQGGTVAGNLTVGALGQFNPVLTVGAHDTAYNWLCIDGGMGQARSFFYYTGGVSRWSLSVVNSNEPGDNTGCDLAWQHYLDDGTIAGNAMVFFRSTGRITVAGDPVDANGIATKNYVDTHATLLREQVDALAARLADLESPGV